ncbi:MAG: hypothetical protein ACYC1M_12975 [Armatimonadota bacterium]
MRISSLLAIGGLCSFAALSGQAAEVAPWLKQSPENLPKVTVRWEDAAQQNIFIVEGEQYQCRVGTQPAKILSLTVNGKQTLPQGGSQISFTDAKGQKFLPAPAEYAPSWNVFRGQHWVPADSSRARMNVWSATPYYWDAHLLDIPMVREDILKSAADVAEKPLKEWNFKNGQQGWKSSNNTKVGMGSGTLSVASIGFDPNFASPAFSIKGPVDVVVRMRTLDGGGLSMYWSTVAKGLLGTNVQTVGSNGDGEWHNYRFQIADKETINMLRFDPPSESGKVEVQSVKLYAPLSLSTQDKIVRGEIIFHAYPDQLRIEFRAEPADGVPAPKTVLFAPFTGKLTDSNWVEETKIDMSRPLVTVNDSTAILGDAQSKLTTEGWESPMTGKRPGALWVVKPYQGELNRDQIFVNDLHPLSATAAKITNGEWLGYEANSGLYVMHASNSIGQYSFENAYANPMRRVQAGVSLSNDNLPRQIVMKAMTGIGCLEATVITDKNGFPLPTAAFVAKNFAGEMEEPDDSAFGDAYFPITLSAQDNREFMVQPLMQTWGDHMLKQISSIRFFNIYWHLSTGVSETTCFTHNWMQIGKSEILHIPDFRPLSGPFWPGQPQHACEQWPGFLQYNNGKGKLVFERTIFNSISPNFSHYTNLYHTGDNAAKGSLTIWEIPQRDEMRTFVKMRFDWTKPVAITGDARQNFRWMNVYEFNTPKTLMMTAPSGKTTLYSPDLTGKVNPLGALMSTQTPFAASSPKVNDYGCVLLVRSFKAKLGGKTYTQAAYSALFDKNNGNWWLSVPEAKLNLKPGDYLEAEVMLMPHAEPTTLTMKPERERNERFGMGWPKVEQGIGTLTDKFPTRVTAKGGVASVTLEGGFDMMPIIVEGLTPGGYPMIWRDGAWQNPQAWGGDGVQIDADGKGGVRATVLVPIRQGQKFTSYITDAVCSTGITAVQEVNGRAVLRSAGSGDWSITSPAWYGPGKNVRDSKSPLTQYTGSGSQIKMLPVSVEASGVTTLVSDADGRVLKIDGPKCVVYISDLASFKAYRLKIDGQEQSLSTSGGVLRIELPEGSHTVERL